MVQQSFAWNVRAKIGKEILNSEIQVRCEAAQGAFRPSRRSASWHECFADGQCGRNEILWETSGNCQVSITFHYITVPQAFKYMGTDGAYFYYIACTETAFTWDKKHVSEALVTVISLPCPPHRVSNRQHSRCRHQRLVLYFEEWSGQVAFLRTSCMWYIVIWFHLMNEILHQHVRKHPILDAYQGFIQRCLVELNRISSNTSCATLPTERLAQGTEQRQAR